MEIIENQLIQNLRETTRGKDGKSLFDINASTISYKTGYAVLDYHLGYMVRVHDLDGNFIEEYPSMGVPAGSWVTFIGKPSTGKTTICEQIAANIVRPFKNGSVIHFDLEHAGNYSRITTVTRLSIPEIHAGKYVLREEDNTIADIKKTIVEIYREKKSRPEVYNYDTGKKNEFGEPIIIPCPTVLLIDSIASLASDLNENEKKDREKQEEVGTQTDRMRTTGEISRLVTESLPLMAAANIIVLAVNHIKPKSQVGGMPQPADILYLKQDETMPGGKAPQYYASILIRVNALGSEKYTTDDDGFDGFGASFDIIKNRVNKAGQKVHMIYDLVNGYDPIRTNLSFAKELGILTGNKNKAYFLENPDVKFSLKNAPDEFKEDKSLYKVMYDAMKPAMNNILSQASESMLTYVEDEYDY